MFAKGHFSGVLEKPLHVALGLVQQLLLQTVKVRSYDNR